MSFRFKTILGVAAIEAVLLAVLVWSGLRFIAETGEREFTDRARATVTAFAVTIKDPLISSDLASIESFVAEMLSYPGVRYAQVRDSAGRLLAQSGVHAPADEQFAADPDVALVDDGVFDVRREVTESGMRFGEVRVGLSTDSLHEISSQARRFGISLALLEMVLVGLFSLALGIYLTRQLAGLVEGSKRLAAGELGYQVPVQGRDELAMTAEAFNAMSARVRDGYEHLRRREERTRRILENIQDGIVTIDAGGAVTSLSPAAELVFGRSSEEFAGSVFIELIAPHEAEQVAALMKEHSIERVGVRVETAGRHAGGGEFQMELQLSAIDGDDTDQTIAVVRDISERARDEAALRLRERIIEATSTAVVVADATSADNPVIYVNPAFERITGYPSSEVIGRNCRFLQGPETDPVALEAIRRGLRDGSEVRVEVVNYRRDGGRFWNELYITPIPGRDGVISHFVALQSDISARKESEAALHEAKAVAEDAAAAKSNFLANMSHEIRTPMHGVLAALEMLRDTPLERSQRRYVDVASSSADVLLAVIDEILDFSRIESGMLRIETIDFELRRAVEDVVAMLGHHARAKALEVACFIAPEVPVAVEGDPVRLRQVLINLVGNAIKFTEQGEVVTTVTCDARPDDAPGLARLRFEVRDTGIGIDPEKHEDLFEPFVQADGTTSRRYGGTGLGLSITRRLVELMGGEIDFESTPGEGARFWFTLPVRIADSQPDAPRFDVTGLRSLIVDDNTTNRVILHRYLTAWGIHPGSAANGAEALAKLHDAAIANRPYDLLLLDLQMPEMSGIELLRRVKDDPALAGIGVIMLSSSSYDPALVDELQIDVWLDKPVRQSDLQDAIMTLCRRTSGAQAKPSVSRDDEIRFSGERVLLAEDSPVTQALTREMLERRGLEVVIAADGVEAVTAFSRGRFDIVLMDIQMPELDGYRATEAIRRMEDEQHGRPTPIVALTAHALPEDREKAREAGMDDYLVKPYDARGLCTVIARWLMPPGRDASDGGSHAGPVLDPARLAEVRSLMGPRTNEILGKVGASISAHLTDVELAREAADLPRLRDAAHALRNAAGEVGAGRLREVAETVERSAQTTGPRSAEMASLRAASDEAVGAVQALIGGSTQCEI